MAHTVVLCGQVIGSNKRDAAETVATLLADLETGRLNVPSDPAPEVVDQLLAARGVAVVDHAAWLRIDGHEKARGATSSGPRVKAPRWEELLELARRSEPG